MIIKYYSKRIIALVVVMLCGIHTHIFGLISSYSYSDPYPVFTTLDPQTYLETRERLFLKGFVIERDYERFGLSVSMFAQNSNSTRPDCLVTPPFRLTTPPFTVAPPCNFTCQDNDTCLGNIHGRWSMLGLLLGSAPIGLSLPPTLLAARAALASVEDCPVTVLTQQYIDELQNIGFFDVPMRYKKRGVRFDLKGKLGCDFGFSFNVGLADISQTIAFFDRTGPVEKDQCLLINDCVSVDGCTLKRYLMENLDNIASEICLNITDFHKFSAEDLRFGIFWRHAYDINTNRKNWEQFLLIPFFHLEASFPVGAPRNYNKFTSLSFGSNDLIGFGFTAGLSVDFTQTIEVGGEFGCTHFFGKDIHNFAVPNSPFQSGIYPFRTDVHLQPGNNWLLGLKMQAYHFLGNLSFYFEYIFVDHMKDCIKLKKPDPAFFPEVLEKISSWRSQLANIAFNYDISPDISLGFLWQTPLPSTGTYRSTTVMVSFNVQY